MLNNFDETKIINTLKDVILNIKSHITSESFYDKYIYTITLNSFNNSIIFINLADSFGKKIFDSTYSAIFLDLFKKYFNENIAIQTCLPNEKPILPRTIDLQDYKETNLMNDVTFGSLQIGEFNKNAFKAGEMIAKNKKWNIFYIYGGIGIGKTSLLHAIGNEFYKNNVGSKIIFLNSDEIIRNIYTHTNDGVEIEKIKDFYGSYDALIVDDIQNFNGKEKISEIFFKDIIFPFVNKNKFFIFSSDSELSKQKKLNKKIISILDSQMSCEISKPDLFFLKNLVLSFLKSELPNCEFTESALDYFSTHCNGEIRNLRGLVSKISFYFCDSEKHILTIENILSVLNNFKSSSTKTNYSIDIKFLVEKVCNYYKSNFDEIVGLSRISSLNPVRYICMYLLFERFGVKLIDIGKFFSGRTHSAVIAAIKKIKSHIKNDKNYLTEIEKLIEEIKKLN